MFKFVGLLSNVHPLLFTLYSLYHDAMCEAIGNISEGLTKSQRCNTTKLPQLWSDTTIYNL